MEFVFIRNKTTYFVNVAIFEFDIHGTRGYAVAVVGEVGNQDGKAVAGALCGGHIEIFGLPGGREYLSAEFA